jgi:hypothetical protein
MLQTHLGIDDLVSGYFLTLCPDAHQAMHRLRTSHGSKLKGERTIRLQTTGAVVALGR